jgi:predicted nucleic acid-binding protein
MTTPIETFAGSALYVDTMVFHIFLRAKDALVESVFNRAQAGEFIPYTSVLTFDELAYRLLLARIRDLYPGSPLDHLRDNGRQLTAQLFPEIAQKLAELRLFPNLFLIDVTPTDVMAMNQNVLSYHIRPRDALHLAAMQKVGCLHLWSEDGDFDDVPGVVRYSLEGSSPPRSA